MSYHLYLVTKELESPTSSEVIQVWKWGITSQTSFRKRSSSYLECFRWEEAPSKLQAYTKLQALAIERKIGAIVRDLCVGTELNTTLWNCPRTAYDEEIQQTFPLHVLMEIFDYALGLRRGLIPADSEDSAMEGFRAMLAEWRQEVPQTAELAPMW